MKTIYLCLTSALATCAITVCALNNIYHEKFKAYEEYVKASDALLHEVERTNLDWGLYWGDTICEGDTWCEFLDARFNADLGDFTFEY